MHQKKSDAQISEESFGVSSDFSLLHHVHIDIDPNPNPHRLPASTAHKRPAISPHAAANPSPVDFVFGHAPPAGSVDRNLKSIAASAGTARRVLRRLQLRLRLVLLLSLPSLYLFLSNSYLFYLLTALSLASLLLLVLALHLNVVPRHSLRLVLSRSSSFLLPRYHRCLHLKKRPVLWFVGSAKAKSDERPRSGSWVQVYSNGDVYEGEFRDGKCSGSGVYHYHMSGRFEGDWVDDKYDGYGVETWAKGSRYRGQYRKGLRHGYGVYQFYTGDVYAGEWRNGQSHGRGVHTCEDGSRYVGEFNQGVKHGLGHYRFRNGDSYAGEYFADNMHGFGVYRFANGDQYEGAWHQGMRHGLGMYTFKHRETQAGHWQNGTLVTLSTQNSFPGSRIAVNHSRVLNAVQEARRAAEEAFDLRSVDDRVNKAVTAANGAANVARIAAGRAVQKRLTGIGEAPDPIV